MDLTLFTDIEIIFGLSILILLVFHRLRLSPVLGFLVTGIIAGPHVLGIIRDVEQVEVLAEIGIILLLFTIGVEMSIKELWDIKRFVLLGGGLQVVITSVLVYYISLALGYSSSTALFLGFLVSLSSTAIVLKLLQEKGEMYTPYGKISLGILIFQDIVIVPMILLTPILAGVPSTSGDSATSFLIKGLGIILLVIVSARWIMPQLLFQIVKTRNRELFLVTIIFVVFGTAWLTSNAGLSLALGAFLAGLIISESEYSHQAIGNMMPFKDVFMSFFLCVHWHAHGRKLLPGEHCNPPCAGSSGHISEVRCGRACYIPAWLSPENHTYHRNGTFTGRRVLIRAFQLWKGIWVT